VPAAPPLSGGRRLAREILELLRARPGVTRLSVLGVSLGGLYVRYALGLLITHPWFRGGGCDGHAKDEAEASPGAGGETAAAGRPSSADAGAADAAAASDDPTRRIELYNFVTIVSPAMGVRSHLAGVVDFAVSTVGVVGHTGPDLTLSRAGWGPKAPARVTAAGSVEVPSAGGLLDPVEGPEAAAAWREAAMALGADVEAELPRAALGGEEGGKAGLPAGSEAVPLLLRMSRVGSPFWRGLAAFRSRVVVGVTKDDDKVPYWSAALSSPDTGFLRRLCASSIGDEDPSDGDSGKATPAVTALAGAEPGTFALDDPAVTAALGHDTASGLRAGDRGGASAGSFPHVTGVFLQRPPAPGMAGAASATLTWLAAFRGDGEASPEDVMASCLRAAGSVTTVHLTFSEWGAAAMNHMRAANNSWLPWDNTGEDAVRFVAERCVLA